MGQRLVAHLLTLAVLLQSALVAAAGCGGVHDRGGPPCCCVAAASHVEVHGSCCGGGDDQAGAEEVPDGSPGEVPGGAPCGCTLRSQPTSLPPLDDAAVASCVPLHHASSGPSGALDPPLHDAGRGAPREVRAPAHGTALFLLHRALRL